MGWDIAMKTFAMKMPGRKVSRNKPFALPRRCAFWFNLSGLALGV
jgi:hypothetical protein